MDGEQQPVYEQYQPIKDVKGLKVRIPFEIDEGVLNEIAKFITQNLKVKTVDVQFCGSLRGMLDRKYGQSWNVFVGKNFGCCAVHDRNCFVNFEYKGYTFLIYKSTI